MAPPLVVMSNRVLRLHKRSSLAGPTGPPRVMDSPRVVRLTSTLFLLASSCPIVLLSGIGDKDRPFSDANEEETHRWQSGIKCVRWVKVPFEVVGEHLPPLGRLSFGLPLEGRPVAMPARW
ncbi:hypothetical protein DEO72_LG4g1243 [Vigna unguiculata]|uniref:Uncharacterized protein n=1 Tax=Vigna unguiculata TaxID=3917 RepID=A0A4D6LPD4_VIGUN|nr:hypothetical protein DEO72_LG4g1243 [Vigna unguiculata]